MKPRSPRGPTNARTDAPRRSGAAIDFTMMYLTHDAFRRDLGLLARRASTNDTAGLRTRWHIFKTQLLIHHSVEDAHLWPAVRRAASGRTGAARLLHDMEREHGQLEPLLDAVDHALAAGADRLCDLIGQLQPVLTGHLDHEERDALPLIQAVCSPADWRRFAGHVRRRQGVRGAATYVPWVLDGLDQDGRRRFFAALPPPVRLANHLEWERRYQRRIGSAP